MHALRGWGELGAALAAVAAFGALAAAQTPDRAGADGGQSATSVNLPDT